MALPAAALAVVFIVLLLAESASPLRRRTRPRWRRVAVNLLVMGVAWLAAAWSVRPVSLMLAGWAEARSFGLIGFLPVPEYARLVAGFLLMDLSFYHWHVANHKVRLLWRFHAVHHVDQDLDVSTSFRFHFGEVLYSTLFRAAQVVVIGVPVSLYVAYEVVFQFATMFHHGNVRMSVGFERIVNLFVVTPRMHGVHHSAILRETDSNYSVIFRWWDRLHGTLRLNVPQARIVAGVPAYRAPRDNGFWRLMVMPFLRQRRYWRATGSGSPACGMGRRSVGATTEMVA